jgi:hypothetical protein
MAWQAELTSPVAKFLSAASITVAVVYYDTADQATILHSRTFSFTPTTTGAAIQAEIVREGQVARSAFQRAASINATTPVGTTLAIP